MRAKAASHVDMKWDYMMENVASMTSPPRLLIAAVVLLVVRSAASPRSINDAPREVDRRVHVGNGWETARKPRIPGKVLEAKLVNELTYLCTLNGGRRLSGLGCNVISASCSSARANANAASLLLYSDHRPPPCMMSRNATMLLAFSHW